MPLGANLTIAVPRIGYQITGSPWLIAPGCRTSRYTPAQGRVRGSLRGDGQEGADLELVVEDSGPGMNEEDMARLGERFFRVLGTGKTGSGLGWSIVRRIAARHGLHIALGRSADLGGLRIEVRDGDASA